MTKEEKTMEEQLNEDILAEQAQIEAEETASHEAKEAKKKQHVVEIKEVKVRYKIDVHDYEVRLKSVRKFIAQGNKVKIVVMLRGREMQHSNLAFDLLNRFIADLENDSIQIEKKPQLEGRNVTLYLSGQSS